MLKTITISEAVFALQALEKVTGNMKNPQLFQVGKVRKILQDSLDIARPLVTGDAKKDQWLNKATTLPFEPLVLADVFKGVKKLTPEEFLAIKRLCTDQPAST